MIWQSNGRKQWRNNSRQHAYVNYANTFVVPMIQWRLPTPQSTPEPAVARDEGFTMKGPKPIPVVRLSDDFTASSSKTDHEIVTINTETAKILMSPELQAARERALASLKASRTIRSQSEEREREKEREKELEFEKEREREREIHELWKRSKAEFIEFSSRRRKQFKEGVIENQKLQRKKARDIEWAEITMRVKKIESNVREEREREEKQREAERKRKIELAREIWRKENEDVVDYVWEM